MLSNKLRHNTIKTRKIGKNRQLKFTYLSIQCHKLFPSLVDISTIAHFFCVKNTKPLKNGTVFVKKASSMLMTSSKQEKRLLF